MEQTFRFLNSKAGMWFLNSKAGMWFLNSKAGMWFLNSKAVTLKHSTLKQV